MSGESRGEEGRLPEEAEGALHEESPPSTEEDPEEPPRFRSTRELAIHVPDLDAARTFYGDALGFELVGESEGLLVFGTGELRLYVVADEEVVPPVPALEVDDYEAARSFLERIGCEIVERWDETRALYVRDPFGLLWDVVEPEG